jgi:hypothetical protein
MSDTRIIATLNRLLAIEYRSLSMYLADGAGAPWLRDRDQQAWHVLSGIARDQQRMTERIAEAVLDRRGSPHSGEFPVEYTDLNFLSLEYLLAELLYYQRQDIENIEASVSQLGGDAQAQALAQEALGNARAHLELMEGLAKQQPA